MALVLASAGVGAAIMAVRDGSRSTSFPRSLSLPRTSPPERTLPEPTQPAPDLTPTPQPGAGTTGSLNAAAIAARVDPAVVNITTTLDDNGGQVAGTGMVLTASGEILTNNHVIADATDIRVQIAGVGPTQTATVIGYDVADDVAVLQIHKASGLKTITPGSSSAVSVGDPIVAIGNALGRGGTPTVTQGAVTAVDQTITAGDPGSSTETLHGMIQIDAPIQAGDSGGPLVNADAQVVGMNTAAAARFRRRVTSNVGFAIPIDAALSIARQIESGHSSGNVHVGPRALLGVQVQDVDAQSQGGGSFGGGVAAVDSGALVARVEPGTPADSADLVAGDVIVSFGGETIGSASDLDAAITTHHPRDRVDVGWVDGSGQRHNARVRLATGPPA